MNQIFLLAGLTDVRFNTTLWTSVLAWAVAQFIKMLLELKRTKKVNTSLLISSGGMPSSHTAFVCAMSTSIGLKSGFDTSLFALSAVISMVIMYDAAGVRRAAGKQAEVINMLVETIENTGIKMDKKLKELLGHSPIEVAAGAVLGIVISVVCIQLRGA